MAFWLRTKTVPPFNQEILWCCLLLDWGWGDWTKLSCKSNASIRLISSNWPELGTQLILNNVAAQMLGTSRHLTVIFMWKTFWQMLPKPRSIILRISHRPRVIRIISCSTMPATNITNKSRSGWRANDAVLHPWWFFFQRRNWGVWPLGARNLPDSSILLGKINHQKIHTECWWWKVTQCNLVNPWICKPHLVTIRV